MKISQVTGGVILNYIVIALNSLVGVLYTPYMLRMLGQNEYGIYSLATSIIAYLCVMDFGFGNAIIKYVAHYRAIGEHQKQQELLGMFSCIYIGIGIITFILGIWLGLNTNYFFDNTLTNSELQQTQIIIFLLAFNLGFTFVFNVYNSAITAYEDFIFQKVVQVLRILLNTAVMIALLYWGYKAVSLVISQTAFNIITQLLNWYYFKYQLQIKIKFGHFDWDLCKEICRYSFWIFLATIIDRLYWSTGPFILGAEVGTIAVAIFSVAMTLEHIFLSFSTSISSTLFPRITRMVTQNIPDREISGLFIKTGRIQFFIIGFIFSGFIIFGKSFIHLWAGDDYTESYYCVLLLLAGLIIPLIQNIGISILQARNKLRFRTLCYLVLSICCVVGQYFCSKWYGALGCSLVIFLTLLLGQGLAMNIYYWKFQKLEIPRFWLNIAKMSIVPTLITFLTINALHLCPAIHSWSILTLSILSYSIIYLVVTIKLSLNDYERSLIYSTFHKITKI